MNVLILGGTGFAGRHIADAFAQRGHRVVLFNRGSNPDVHADLEQIHGDRSTDLPRLDGRTWDAAIDTSAYTPDVAAESARYFKGKAARYVFISTRSVYDHGKTFGPDEDAPLLAFPEHADPTQYAAERYGALKVLCEESVHREFRDAVTVLRPAIVAGPFDPTDRFTYWPLRFDRGGEVITPPLDGNVQYIDARDLAAFAAHAVETSLDGTYNCVTPRGSVTFGDLVQACMQEASSQNAVAVPLPDEFLIRHGVRPWSDLPLWIPAADEYAPIANTDSSRAIRAGLFVRPLRETVRDTLAWACAAHKRLGALKAGLAPGREAELLAA